jgi:putative hydrolase of HD superfamily
LCYNMAMNKENQKFIDFLIYSERLKTEHRHAHKSNGQPESAAEHSWRLSLMVMLIEPKLQKRLDMLKTLKMATIHDIVEIDAEDVLVLEHIDNKEKKNFKDSEEERAMLNIQALLGNDGNEISELWHEYLTAETYEARILHVLNMIEGQTQFLSENVKKFTHAEQDSVAKLISKTAELAKIDPYLEQLYFDCGEIFRERTLPE